ncbi:uncharacterized protein LOC135931797 [Gordionus sp. m RMFG-2023]|uniref:uncharacterized protein LOC135931797 n=1 Tax=Gordionus sp. m RMFG-2023 TaxID=3053472 RepID=UPI0031FD134D
MAFMMKLFHLLWSLLIQTLPEIVVPKMAYMMKLFHLLSSSQNGLYDEIIPLATEFVDPKSPRAARVLLIDSGSQNVEFEDKNIQLDRDFINPKTPIELDDDILIINKLENIPRYFFPTTKVWKKYHAKIYGLKPPKRCRDVDYGKQLGEPTILVQIEGRLV